LVVNAKRVGKAASASVIGGSGVVVDGAAVVDGAVVGGAVASSAVDWLVGEALVEPHDASSRLTATILFMPP
jgi:hypothetical protein